MFALFIYQPFHPKFTNHCCRLYTTEARALPVSVYLSILLSVHFYGISKLVIYHQISYKWASAWDFQQCGMCDQQSLRSSCAYAQSDQRLSWLLEYSLIVKLLTEHNLEFLSVNGGCTGSSESSHVKMLEICIAFIKLWLKIEYAAFWPMKGKQDDHQNSHCLSVCTCGHSSLVIYHVNSFVVTITIFNVHCCYFSLYGIMWGSMLKSNSSSV